MSCPAKNDSSREEKTWKWSAWKCPNNNPTLSDCPSGFTGSIGSREDAPFAGGWGCADVFSSANRAKCYKDIKSFSNDDLVKCCIGAKDSYSCPPEYCSQNTSNCINILPSYCRKDDNITTEACRTTLKKANEEMYNEILDKYCVGENLNKQVCKDYCKANLSACSDNLKEFCKDKIGNPKYDAICACFYDDKVYIDISTKLAKDWNFPEELNDPRAQCVYDKCKQATIVPAGECKAISIASCIQNVNIDTKGETNIENVYIKQDSQCLSKFTKNSDDNGSSSSTTDNKSGSSTTDTSDNKSGSSTSNSTDDKSSMSLSTIGFIVGSVILLILLIIIGVIIYKKRK
jgi:hypothetical protein